MTRDRFLALVGAVIAVIAVSHDSPMTDSELVVYIDGFQLAIQDQAPETVQALLRDQVVRYLGKRVRIDSATVAATYERENTTHLYFGVNYDPGDHLLLSEIDPSLEEFISSHHLWASVTKTYSSRQLSYELPIDRDTFDQLDAGQSVTFSCKIAALIRGKSVYCVPTEFQIIN